eukprot:scaffold164963_cov35-Attheya_sp.AAC.1
MPVVKAASPSSSPLATAASTLSWMGVLSLVFFLGLTTLSVELVASLYEGLAAGAELVEDCLLELDEGVFSWLAAVVLSERLGSA